MRGMLGVLGVVLLAPALLAASCCESQIRIGVLTDEPGMSFQDPSTTVRSGFEISMYQWMAENTEPKFSYFEVELTIEQRERALEDRKVDVVVGSYSITDYRRTLVGFAGPYLISQQGIMVRADSPLRDIKQADQIANQTACAQTNSTSAEQLRRVAGGSVTVREAIGLQQCVELLRKGEVDAVSTDQILLKGYQAQDNDFVVPEKAVFGTFENYGIGLPKGDKDACEEWRSRILSFLASNAWNDFYRQSFGQPPPAGVKPSPGRVGSCPDE